jgi:hypothetical protein
MNLNTGSLVEWSIQVTLVVGIQCSGDSEAARGQLSGGPGWDYGSEVPGLLPDLRVGYSCCYYQEYLAWHRPRKGMMGHGDQPQPLRRTSPFYRPHCRQSQVCSPTSSRASPSGLDSCFLWQSRQKQQPCTAALLVRQQQGRLYGLVN